jgi:hypothetical protein
VQLSVACVPQLTLAERVDVEVVDVEVVELADVLGLFEEDPPAAAMIASTITIGIPHRAHRGRAEYRLRNEAILGPGIHNRPRQV